MYKKSLIALLILAIGGIRIFAQAPLTGKGGEVMQFIFHPGNDTLYLQGNESEFKRLYSVIDQYMPDIASGKIPIQINGYCASAQSEEENTRLAFTRSNRVKSELITHKNLVEHNFITKNYTTAYEDHKDIVVVKLRIVEVTAFSELEIVEEPVVEVVKEDQIIQGLDSFVEEQSEWEPLMTEPTRVYSRWSVGANVGLPFFWGDMTSTSSNKTYIGVMAGIQATYQISPMFGVTLSFDWAQNKAGSRSYAKDYLLDANGMTWYTPQSFSTQSYGDIYSKINMYNAGLHLDVNVNRLFGSRIANSRLKLIASPAVYGQHFSSKVYTKADDKVFVGNHLGKDLSIGLGGDVALRYDVNRAIDVQLKGTGIWITDNNFDNIRTVGHVKQNAMWGISAGVVWKIIGSRDTNLLYKNK